MSIDVTIRNGLNTAFRLLTGLKKTVVFKRKTSANRYDFNNRFVDSGTVEDTIVEAVVLKDEKMDQRSATNTNSRKLQLLYKTEDVGDISSYDEVEVMGYTWKIGQAPLSETGHVSYVEVYREVDRG